MKTYPIAPNGIFWTVQGEGALLGVPMRFIRLAGCSVGCPECDTNYAVDSRMSVEDIAAVVDALPRTEWSFITGGEPADHDIWPLFEMLDDRGRVAVVTSGTKSLPWFGGKNFVSVSPHFPPERLAIKGANQINLVPGLNGLRLADWQDFDFSMFDYRYVTPLHGTTTAECERWLKSHPDFRLGIQAHKTWGVA